MPHVKLDQTDSASVTRTTAGWQIERIAAVTGLDGQAMLRMIAALAAPGLPALGDAHPTIPGLYVVSLTASSAGPSAAAVRILYHSPSPAQPPPVGQPALVELGATLSESTAAVDAAGSPIAATVTVSGVTLTQRAELPRLEPQSTLRFTRMENASPAAAARNYVGKINATAAFASDPATLMCTAITARSTDAGRTYETRYDFQYRPDGWQPTVIYIDPATNRPHPSATPQLVTLYHSAEFNDLGL